MDEAKGGSDSKSGVREIPENADYIRPYVPKSWFHPVGAFQKRAEVLPKLPRLKGALFLTLTVDPKYFGSPSTAFDHSRKRLRKVFYALRKGVMHAGKLYQIDAPYLTKVEFHKSGYAHFHIIFRSRNYLPPRLLDRLWKLGRTNVKRIRNRQLDYLLKYVTKGEGLPEWVKERNRLRILQPSRGFYESWEAGRERPPVKDSEHGDEEDSVPRPELTIGQRIEKWSKTAVLKLDGRYATVLLGSPYLEIFSRVLFDVAFAGRYLGNWVVRISGIRDLLAWEI